MPRKLLFLVPILLFAVVAGFFLIGLGRDPRIVPSALLDKPAPDFALPGLLPEQPGLATADLEAQRPALINVFASWCLPCRAEHPLLMDLAAKGEVAIYGINYKDAAADAKGWLAELGNPYSRIGVDADGRASIDWGVYGVPETFLVDGQGVIRYKHVGPMTRDVIDETILPIYRELAK